ncbi:MAG TPA: serine hydrolase [Candidatus Dormibacteraeota bacterium]|nr:serine hydrolase [Candidatus Dormibacteraeota bacterium]
MRRNSSRYRVLGGVLCIALAGALSTFAQEVSTGASAGLPQVLTIPGPPSPLGAPALALGDLPGSALPAQARLRPVDILATTLQALVDQSGAHVAVALRELDSAEPESWSLNAQDSFEAGSTYKLPALEAEAEELAAGQVRLDDQLCYQDSDWEDGPFGDYSDGACYSRGDLMNRVGQYSDNTAAHILVDDLGGPQALQDFATEYGAVGSDFANSNTTTAADLAALMEAEASGVLGGEAAQKILYPLITNTIFEAGLPAGVPAGVQVVHKVGLIDASVNDAGLILAPGGRYVVVVLTDGLSSADAWTLIAAISSAVWQFEDGSPGVRS